MMTRSGRKNRKSNSWYSGAWCLALILGAACAGDVDPNACSDGKCDGWEAPLPQDLNSTLPVLVIQTLDGASYDTITERGKEQRTKFLLEAHDKEDGLFGDFEPREGAVRLRGTSSARNQKVSLDLKMEKKMKLKGMGKTKRWVLYAPYIDKSMLRNVMGYELARQLGLTAPLTRFVEVYVNDEYIGIYVLMPKIKDDMACDEYETETGGCIPDLGEEKIMLQRDGRPKEDEAHVITPISNIPILFDAPDENPEEFHAKVEARLTELEETLCADDFASRYHELLDVDSFVNFFILRELFGDLDGFRRSMNFYVNSDDKLVIGPVWDLDGGSGAVRFSVITRFTTVIDRILDRLFGPWHRPDHDWIVNFNLPPVDFFVEQIGLDRLPQKLVDGIDHLHFQRRSHG